MDRPDLYPVHPLVRRGHHRRSAVWGLADRLSRRGALVGAGVFQAAATHCGCCCPASPDSPAVVLWGLGGALQSGSLEALLSTGSPPTMPSSVSAAHGRIEAVRLFAQVPAAGAGRATVYLGGFDLVGWVSVGCCRRRPHSRPGCLVRHRSGPRRGRRLQPATWPCCAPGRRGQPPAAACAPRYSHWLCCSDWTGSRILFPAGCAVGRPYGGRSGGAAGGSPGRGGRCRDRRGSQPAVLVLARRAGGRRGRAARDGRTAAPPGGRCRPGCLLRRVPTGAHHRDARLQSGRRAGAGDSSLGGRGGQRTGHPCCSPPGHSANSWSLPGLAC